MKIIIAIILIWIVVYHLAKDIAKSIERSNNTKVYKYKHEICKQWLETKETDHLNDMLLLAIKRRVILRYIIFGADKSIVIFLDKNKQSPIFKFLSADKIKFKNMSQNYLLNLSKLRKEYDQNNINNIKKYPELGPYIYNWSEEVDTEDTEYFKDFHNYKEYAYKIEYKNLNIFLNLLKLYL